MLVYFHGGGYFSGRKTWEAQWLLYRLASEGWVCISANYRLRPRALFLDHLIDAKRAIAGRANTASSMAPIARSSPRPATRQVPTSHQSVR